jgi:uncharacterized membrane protein HdeD (DUF308 family)
MTTTGAPSPDLDRPNVVEVEVTRAWWVLLVTGALWLVFGWVVLSVRNEITTVWAVAVYAGILFVLFGAGEWATAFVAPGWRWLHALLGFVAFAAGICAFVWPEHTFFTLAAVIGWFLLFEGTLQIGGALASRHESDLWWMLLVIGVIDVLIAFWAIGYPGRSVALLIIWVGASALAKGLTQIVSAFALRSAERAVAAP